MTCSIHLHGRTRKGIIVLHVYIVVCLTQSCCCVSIYPSS